LLASASPKKKKKNEQRSNIALKQQPKEKVDDDDGDLDQQGYIHSQTASPTMAELETVRITDGP